MLLLLLLVVVELLLVMLELCLLVTGRQIGNQGPVQVVLGQVQRLMEEGHVVLVFQVAEGRLEVEQRPAILGLDAVLVRLSGLGAGEEAVRDVLEAAVAARVVVAVVEVEAELVDVGERVDGRGHAAHFAARGRRYVGLAGAEDGAGRGSVGHGRRDLSVVRG